MDKIEPMAKPHCYVQLRGDSLVILVGALLLVSREIRAERRQSAFQQIINDQIAAFNADDGLRAIPTPHRYQAAFPIAR